MLFIIFSAVCAIVFALAAPITGNYWLFVCAVAAGAAFEARLSRYADEKEKPWALR